MSESYFQEAVNTPEAPEDLTLRPPGFEDFHGQDKVTERLMLMVTAAKGRDDVLEHVLLSGPPGLGKTTLANIVATAVGTTLHTTSGPQIEKAGDLAGVLTNLQRGDILLLTKSTASIQQSRNTSTLLWKITGSISSSTPAPQLGLSNFNSLNSLSSAPPPVPACSLPHSVLASV